MAKAVKLADIAEQLGVSTVTVSKALSGQKGVSEAMREKIKQLADELGYKQPSAVKKEKSVKSYNIGVLVSEKYLGEYASFYWKMYQSVATRAVQPQCSFSDCPDNASGSAESSGCDSAAFHIHCRKLSAVHPDSLPHMKPTIPFPGRNS